MAANDSTNDLEVAGQLFQSEVAEVGAMNISPAKKAELIDKSYQKYANSLRNHGVTQATIAIYGDMIKKMPEQVSFLLTGMADTLKMETQALTALQQKQADHAMDKSNRIADATTGIAAFATILSTVARYFGYDDFADGIEAKTKDIMGNIKISLNTDGIGRGMDEKLNTYGKNLKSVIVANAKDVTTMVHAVGKSEPLSLPTVMTPYTGGNSSTPAAAKTEPTAQQAKIKGVEWDQIKDTLVKSGASADDQTKVQTLFSKVSKGSGEPATIDTMDESANLIKAIKAESSLKKYAPEIKNTVNREMHITGNT